VEGIGAKRAKAIMNVYASLEAVAAADPASLAKRCGVPENTAKAVRAAAKLALEDRVLRERSLAAGRTAPGNAEAETLAELAAQEEPAYGGD
jgi:3-methyladenine DNA glycosylase/8-oxoguanine DNA glycosylase